MHQDLCCCCYCLPAVAVAAAFVAVAATVAADVATEHIVQCHHVRLNIRAQLSLPSRSTKPPSMTLSSATFYSTPACSTLHNIYMLYYYSTNSLSHSPIASNYEKRSYCSCCIIGDFFSHNDVLAIAGCRVNVHCR